MLRFINLNFIIHDIYMLAGERAAPSPAVELHINHGHGTLQHGGISALPGQLDRVALRSSTNSISKPRSSRNMRAPGFWLIALD